MTERTGDNTAPLVDNSPMSPPSLTFKNTGINMTTDLVRGIKVVWFQIKTIEENCLAKKSFK